MALVQVRGINNTGQILGLYQEAASSSLRSMLRSADGGTYVPIAVPGASQTFGAGLNNLGQITGSYIDDLGMHSFIRAAVGTYTTFDIPLHDAPRPPTPAAMNDRGEITGTAYAAGSTVWGFLLSADRMTYTTVQVPNANATEVVAINNNGEIFGTCQFGGSYGLKHGFIRAADGSYRLIDAPGAIQETALSGANNRGQMVVNGMTLNSDGSSSSLDSTFTVAGAAIDDGGRMAGCVVSGAGCRGFLAVPIGGTQPIIRAQRGVISASAFGGSTTISPAGWIEIYGSNLSNTTRQWRSADFQGDAAPTMIDGVSVTINGRSAFVSYISPGQINVQVSSDVVPGSAQVTVTNAGRTSASYVTTVTAAQPGILAISQDVAYTYAMALFPDYATYDLPQLQYPSIPPAPPLPSRLARTGDTIILFGVGFGAVTPAVRAGQIAPTSSSLQGTFEVLFAGLPARILYAGLAPGWIGLYQFNVVVPEGVRGEVPIELRLNGTSLAQTKLYAALQ